MNVLVCPDKFKGSLSATQVCQAIKSGVLRHSPTANVVCHPMSDGGDGMLDILAKHISMKQVSVEVNDPLFRPVLADYGISVSGDTAYIEMSRASGLALLKASELNPLETTTLGTGELILDALRRNVKTVILGLGGSATNDAGIGMASALGYRFLDKNGNALEPVGKNLALVDTIDSRSSAPELASVNVIVASDVDNPFFGSDGAATTFARQKGADDAAITLLNAGLEKFARVVSETFGVNLQTIPGAGAAGGLGGGAVALLRASLEPGIEMMIDVTSLGDRIAAADLIITGEGRLDEQTLSGKVIDGVVRTAKKYSKQVAVLCGSSTLSPKRLAEFGVFYCGVIMTDGRSLQDAMSNGYHYLEESAFTLMSVLNDPERAAS